MSDSDIRNHYYNAGFFDYIEWGARRSARIVVPLILKHLTIRSVLDIGCGRGIWLAEWLHCGVTDIRGIDGGYVSLEDSAIPKESFHAADLTKPFALGRTFDLVVSLEVAEHIPEQNAETFVDNLVAHSDLILFSAAVPGQSGEFHVNEQPYDYWRTRFARRSFRLFDFLRPHLRGCGEVEPWYRYNTFLFAGGTAVQRLPRIVTETEVPLSATVTDITPFHWRLRNRILRTLPRAAVSRLVKLRHSLARLSRTKHTTEC